MEPMYYIPSAVRVNIETVYSASREADLVMTSTGTVYRDLIDGTRETGCLEDQNCVSFTSAFALVPLSRESCSGHLRLESHRLS